MNQWISAVNSYYYPYMIYHVTHERLVFPRTRHRVRRKVVAHALPKVEIGLGGRWSASLRMAKTTCSARKLTIADFYPSAEHVCVQPDRGRQRPCIRNIRHSAGGGNGWKICRRHGNCARSLPPRAPIPHAREWANSHRPKY